MRGILLALALAAGLASAAPAVAQKGQGPKTAIWSTGTTDDPATIDAVLSTMPVTDKDMTYANLGERLQQLGIRVKHINAGPVAVDDVRLDPSLRRGDVHYMFAITKPTTIVEQLCPIGPGFTMIRRGQRWIAQDRTGNFLMNGYGHCRPPA